MNPEVRASQETERVWLGDGTSAPLDPGVYQDYSHELVARLYARIGELEKERDDALRMIAMLVWERGGTCVISAATQRNLPDFELSRTDDVHGAMWVSVNER